MQNDKEKFLSGKPVEKEITELHQFFQDWFNGTIDHDISRFSTVMAERFQIITPEGRIIEREEIIDAIEQGYNTQKGREIWVEDIMTRQVDDLIIATYLELQEYEEKETCRISTALFSFNPNLPNNCSWQHVHETWME